MSVRQMLALFLGASLLLAAGLAIAFQDNITNFDVSDAIIAAGPPGS